MARRRASLRLLALSTVAALSATLSACSRSLEAGSGHPRIGAVAGASAPLPRHGVLCPDSRVGPAVTCLGAALSRYWSSRTGRLIAVSVVLDPKQSALPVACRGVPDDHAYTCAVDRSIYIGATQRRRIQRRYSGRDRVTVLAWVLAHETGHLVQYTLRVPPIDDSGISAARSRAVELQADCLSGVWAGAVAGPHGIDPTVFTRDADALITSISSATEVRTHGSPAQRIAAIRRGLVGRTPQSCGVHPGR